MEDLGFSRVEEVVTRSADVSCDELSSSSDRNVYRYLRTMRMIRLLRLFKVLKIFDVLRDILRVRPAMIRLLKTGFIVFYGAHLGGCFFWLIKVSLLSLFLCLRPAAARQRFS